MTMKKRTFLTIIMAVWAYGMYAQTETMDTADSDTSFVHKVSQTTPVEPQKQEIDYAELVRTFHQYAKAAQNEEITPMEPIKHIRKDWFSRHFHAHQRMELSFTGGSDNDKEDSSELQENYDNTDDEREAVEGKNQFNSGLSAGYTYGLLVGRSDENNTFTPSKFGFSINTGFIFSYDSQKRYGTTFDLLWKLGLESGYNHPLGIEVDFLLGTGKSCGDYTFTLKDDENGKTEDMDIPYTDWCLKYGAQLSLRSNILSTQIKNTDIRLFVRYVYSKNPQNDAELDELGIDNFWQEESWTFGITLCYSF